MIDDLKKLLKDDSIHIGIGKIKKLYLSDDRSVLRVLVSMFPEERDIIATMTWESVGPNCGDFTFPVPDDMVLIGQVYGDDDQAYVLKRLTSRADKIPSAAVNGDKVQKTLDGKKFWNISDTRINLSRGENEPAENLVLGQVFKKFADDLLKTLKDHAQNNAAHKHMGNLGFLTSAPDNANDHLSRKGEYDTLKTSPIGDNKILSDLSFTEK